MRARFRISVAALATLCSYASAQSAGQPATQPSATADPARPIVVAQDGSGDFRTIQAAVDSVPKRSAARQIISIAPGDYRERVQIAKDVTNLTFRGQGNDAARVRIVFDLHAGKIDPATGKAVGTSGSETVLVSGDGFVAEHITFENDAGEKGPAVAVRTMGDRAVFRSCRFLGWQDTLYTNGKRHYFADCHIEGRVDFIFGRATAVFDRCTIVSKNGGYVTAASTPEASQYGLVFLDCKITSNDTTPTDLGRPWRPNAQVAFIRCDLGAHIRPEGWNNWGKEENEKTARYVEAGNTGPGADRAKRVGWSRQLSADEMAAYTVKNILAGEDQWNPQAADTPAAR